MMIRKKKLKTSKFHKLIKTFIKLINNVILLFEVEETT